MRERANTHYGAPAETALSSTLPPQSVTEELLVETVNERATGASAAGWMLCKSMMYVRVDQCHIDRTR